MITREPLSRLGLDTGKKARLHRILYQHGLRNGTGLFLPYDQGLEHGPRNDAKRPGMPLVVWSYPRGSAVDAKGGRDSFYAVGKDLRARCQLARKTAEPP
jgi:DhnA family fructose-bisphosphate aldolase class Ia